MEERKVEPAGVAGDEPDVVQYCPNCGARGTWQKCKLICTTPQCAVRIILACVD